MRKDMHKVIVERPRVGGHGKDKGRKKPNLKVLTDEDALEPAGKEGINKRYSDSRKSLNKNLQPLYRFLNKQIGRPWDKVFKEICENIDLSNTVKRHIREHVDHHVYINVIMIQNFPHFKNAGYKQGEMPLRKGTLWVHPETGILLKVRREFKKVLTKEQKMKADLDALALEYFAFVKIEARLEWCGIQRKVKIIEDLCGYQPLAPKHARDDVNGGSFHKGWLQMKEHRKLRQHHSYFKELFKILGIE